MIGHMTTLLDLLQPLEDNVRASRTAQQDRDDAAMALAAAEKSAVEMLQMARAKASSMIEQARREAVGVREAARAEGFEDGRAAGRNEAEAEVKANWAALLDDVRAEMTEIKDDIVIARQNLWRAQEPEMVRLVLEIARKVVKTEVTQNGDIVLGLLQDAMRRVTDKEHVRIRVSLRDAARVRGMRHELISTLDGIKGLEIVDDRRIGDGGCVIETNAGTIDAKIETQLSEVDRVIEHTLEG